MEKYKVGDKVKLKKDSTYHHQAPDLFGEIVKINDFVRYNYKVKFSNGYENSYKEIDLELVEAKTLTREEVVAEAIRRYSPIKIGDRFNFFIITDTGDDMVKSDKPEEWTFDCNQLYLAKNGDGGVCVYSNGKWAEKITEPFTLPENWAVECNHDCDSTPELLDWRLNKSDLKCKWYNKGYINSNGRHSYVLDYPNVLITYQEFLDHVYNPWKSTQTLIDNLTTKLSSDIKVGDMVEVIHISPDDDEWVYIGKTDIPFKVGDIVKVTSIGNGFEINGNYYYPKSMFKKVVKKNEISSDVENLDEHNGVEVGDVVIITRNTVKHRKGDVVTISKIIREYDCVNFFTPELEKEYPRYDGWLSTDSFEKIDLVGRKIKILKDGLNCAIVIAGDILTIRTVHSKGDCVEFYTENDKKGHSWGFDSIFFDKPDGLELLPIGSDDDIDVHVPHASAMFNVTDTNGTVSITNMPDKSKNSIEDVPSMNVLLKPKKKIKLKID